MIVFIETATLAGLACLSTNIDNLVIVLGHTDNRGALRSSAVFFLTLSLVILTAFTLALGADFLPKNQVGWIGLAPLLMGLHLLWKSSRPGSSLETTHKKLSLTALAVLLAINSGDTLVVQTAVFSDLATAYHMASLAGSLAAASLLTLLAVGFHRFLNPESRLICWARRLQPVILIFVGLFILIDTPFDIL
jgi:cadmium resistance protein CadD (predicted permease)